MKHSHLSACCKWASPCRTRFDHILNPCERQSWKLLWGVVNQCCQSMVPSLFDMTVAPGFASAGDLETAIILLSQMRRLNIQPDSILFNTILYLSCIVCHLCHLFLLWFCSGRNSWLLQPFLFHLRNGCAKRQMRALTEQAQCFCRSNTQTQECTLLKALQVLVEMETLVLEIEVFNTLVVLWCFFWKRFLVSLGKFFFSEESWRCTFQFYSVNSDQALWPMWWFESGISGCRRVSETFWLSLECTSLYLPDVYMYMEWWPPNGFRSVQDHATRWLLNRWQDPWNTPKRLLEASRCAKGSWGDDRSVGTWNFHHSGDAWDGCADGRPCFPTHWDAEENGKFGVIQGGPKLPTTWIKEVTWPSFKLQIEQQIDAIASTIQFRCCEYIHICTCMEICEQNPRRGSNYGAWLILALKALVGQKSCKFSNVARPSLQALALPWEAYRASECQNCRSAKSASRDHSPCSSLFYLFSWSWSSLSSARVAVKSEQVYLYSREVVLLEKVLHTWNALCIVKAIGLFTFSDLVLEQNRRGRTGWYSIDVMLWGLPKTEGQLSYLKFHVDPL